MSACMLVASLCIQLILNTDRDSPDFVIFKEVYCYYYFITILLSITYFIVYDLFYVKHSIIAIFLLFLSTLLQFPARDHQV